MAGEAEAVADWPAAIHQELRALHESMARIEACTRSLADSVGRQNGRVGKLEEAERERQLTEQFAKGEASQRSQAVVTRGQLALFGSLVGVSSGVIGILAKVLG